MPASPMGEALSVSPDGNWIAFSLFAGIDSLDGVYLGNLRDGTSQLIYQSELNKVTGVRDPAPLYYYGWSPDSVHFVFGDWDTRFIGNINGETMPLTGMGILGWIDNSHYFGRSIMGDVDSQEEVLVIDFPPGVDHSESSIAFVFLGH